MIHPTVAQFHPPTARLQTSTIFWRLLWKEYRTQRGFWLALLGLVLFGQFVVWTFPLSVAVNAEMLFALALAGAAFYGLGCAATLYSAEREAKSFERLRLLSASPGGVLASKLSYTIASTALLLLVSWLSALAFSGGVLPVEENHRQLWHTLGVLLLELIVWGLFFSALTRRPLNAVCMAAAAAVLTEALLSSWDFLGWYPVSAYGLKLGEGPLVPRLLLVAVVLGIDAWLLLRWIWARERQATMFAQTRAGAIAGTIDSAEPREWAMGSTALVGEQRYRVLRRLVWQEWRQGVPTVITFTVLGLLLLVYDLFFVWGARGPSLSLVGVALVLLPCLMGASVFRGEHQGSRFRFLANRAVAPGTIWLAKQSVWLSSCVCLILLLWGTCALPIAILGGGPNSFGRVADVLPDLPLIVLIGYSCGQLTSLLFRREVLAGLLALVLAGLVAAWCSILRLCEMPLVWFVPPIPLAMLLATRLRLDDWLVEHNGWRAWWKPVAALAGTLAVVVLTFAGYRVYEIPWSGPGFAVEEYLTPVPPESRATAELYRKAMAVVKPLGPVEDETLEERLGFWEQAWDELPHRLKRWHKANHQAIALTLEAANRPQCTFRAPGDVRFNDAFSQGLSATTILARLLLLDARKLESEGRLDGALDRYLATLRMAQHVADRSESLPVCPCWRH